MKFKELRQRFGKKKLLAAVALVLVAALGIGIFLGTRGGGDPVDVYAFQFIGMTEYWGDSQESYGPVTTDRIQTVFLSDTQTVKEILVKAGDTVKKGDKLMSFDTTLDTLSLERKQLELEKIKLQIKDAEARLRDLQNQVPLEKQPFYQDPEEETEPDLGAELVQAYQISENRSYDGSTQEKALICWMREGTVVDDGLLDALAQRAWELQQPQQPLPPSSASALPTTAPVVTEETTAVTTAPATVPTTVPTTAPATEPTTVPTTAPATEPTTVPTTAPATEPTTVPTTAPATEPTTVPTTAPATEPTTVPTTAPATEPTTVPTTAPATEPTTVPTTAPATEPTTVPTTVPATEPSTEPTTNPATEPTSESTEAPTTPPTTEPTEPTEPAGAVDSFYVVMKVTQENKALGAQTTWQGLQVSRNASGEYGFRFFDAAGMTDYTLVETQGQPQEVPNYGSFYTAKELARMREEARKNISDLEFTLKMAEAECKIMERELGDGNIYAEVDGEVISVLPEEEAKAAMQPVVKVSGGGGFYIQGSVSELEKENLNIGQEVTINDWNTGQTYTGKVESVGDFPTGEDGWSGAGNPNASYYPFQVFVDGTADLEAGRYVSVTYSTAQAENGLYLENAFLRKDQGAPYVYARGSDGKLEKRFVTVGKSLWGSYTQVFSGITQEDWLAFPYGKQIKEGAQTVESDLSSLYTY